MAHGVPKTLGFGTAGPQAFATLTGVSRNTSQNRRGVWSSGTGYGTLDK